MSDDDFELEPTLPLYPEAAGFKERGGTSEDAAATVNAETLRAEVLECLGGHDLTADECAGELAESVLSIRPRFSELFKMGRIVKTETRRPNRSGKMATVWALKER